MALSLQVEINLKIVGLTFFEFTRMQIHYNLSPILLIWHFCFHFSFSIKKIHYCDMGITFNDWLVSYMSPGGGGGDSNTKKVGVLVVSLRGVNFRVWSRLGCEEKLPIFLAFKVSLRVAREEMHQIF